MDDVDDVDGDGDDDDDDDDEDRPSVISAVRRKCHNFETNDLLSEKSKLKVLLNGI